MCSLVQEIIISFAVVGVGFGIPWKLFEPNTRRKAFFGHPGQCKSFVLLQIFPWAEQEVREENVFKGLGQRWNYQENQV